MVRGNVCYDSLSLCLPRPIFLDLTYKIRQLKNPLIIYFIALCPKNLGGLNLPHRINSLARSAKSTLSPPHLNRRKIMMQISFM